MNINPNTMQNLMHRYDVKPYNDEADESSSEEMVKAPPNTPVIVKNTPANTPVKEPVTYVWPDIYFGD